VAIGVGTSAIAAGFTPAAIPFVAWALLPYIALRLVARRVTDRWALALGGLAVLAGEVFVRLEIVRSRSSTAAIALLFSPVYLTCLVLPAGLLLGWLVGQGWRRSGLVGRGALAAGGLACLGLAVVAVARPGLLPGALAQRLSARERIGLPRIVTGDRTLSRTVLDRRRAWYQLGELDDEPGEELAAVAGGRIALLDPATGAC
jgi:hypothetical protein